MGEKGEYQGRGKGAARAGEHIEPDCSLVEDTHRGRKMIQIELLSPPLVSCAPQKRVACHPAHKATIGGIVRIMQRGCEASKGPMRALHGDPHLV
jgi:hypothetical protein